LPTSIEPFFFSSKPMNAALMVVIRRASRREIRSAGPITWPPCVLRVIAACMARSGWYGFNAPTGSNPCM
jgi:hypothetical protein